MPLEVKKRIEKGQSKMLCPFSIHNIQYSQFASLETLIAALGKVGSEALEKLHKQYQDDYRDYHNEVFIAVVAVIDGNFAETAAADDAAHCGIT